MVLNELTDIMRFVFIVLCIFAAVTTSLYLAIYTALHNWSKQLNITVETRHIKEDK